MNTVAAEGFSLGLRSQTKEISIDSIPVEGRIPSWLRGCLYRNGPALFEVNSRPMKHWFDGFGMIHRFSFQDGGVGYRNRFVRSESYEKTKRADKLHDMQFGTNVSDSRFQSALAFWMNGLSVTDNTSVNLIPGQPGELIALTEAKFQQRIDSVSLETRGHVDHQDSVGYVIGSAHPHYDFERQETISYGIDLSLWGTYVVYRQGRNAAQREAICRIRVKRPSYMHSFSITRNHVILIENPLTANPLSFLFSGKAFIDNFEWDSRRGTMFYVVDRRTGKVRRIEGQGMFHLHTVNAWEDGNEIVLDLSAYPSAAIIDYLRLENLRRPNQTRAGPLRRFRINPDRGTVRDDEVYKAGIELPTINYRANNMRAYRYTYGISGDGQGVAFDRIIKVDTRNGDALTWREEHCTPAEPIFVPGPDSRDEDAGVVLSVVLDAKAEQSFLLILDARSFSEMGRVRIPVIVPFGFHGLYVS